jgi:hypothetical protein
MYRVPLGLQGCLTNACHVHVPASCTPQPAFVNFQALGHLHAQVNANEMSYMLFYLPLGLTRAKQNVGLDLVHMTMVCSQPCPGESEP